MRELPGMKPDKMCKTNKTSNKRTPLRRCAVCRRQSAKEDFLRAVLTKDGKVSLDESGKAQGRGAYVCKTDACVNKLVKQRGFNRSFKRDAGAEVYEAAAAYINGLFSLRKSAHDPSFETPPDGKRKI